MVSCPAAPPPCPPRPGAGHRPALAVVVVVLAVALLAPVAVAGGGKVAFGLEALMEERLAELTQEVGVPPSAWRHPLGEPMEDAARRPRPRTKCIDDGEHAGVPIGGLGAGSIGQTYRGDFRRWHLRVGHHHAESIPGSLFAVHVARGAGSSVGGSAATALTALGPPEGGAMSAVSPRLPGGGGGGEYHALFPRAWRVYDPLGLGAARGAPPLLLVQEQLSPVIAHDYTNSSLPVGVHEFTAGNPSEVEAISVSLLLTWENVLAADFWGARASAKLGARLEHECRSAPAGGGGAAGAVLSRSAGGGPPVEDFQGSMAIAALAGDGVEVTCQPYFDAAGDGSDVWNSFSATGELQAPPRAAGSAPPARPGAAVAIKFVLHPGESRKVAFAISWDLPVVRFGRNSFAKAYTTSEGGRWGRSGTRAFDLASHALASYPAWQDSIAAWQRPILEDQPPPGAPAGPPPGRPPWYRAALFNELYYVVDGGTLWGTPIKADGALDESAPRASFGLLECFDYPYYNTLDVHYYGSWALLLNWPKLEMGVARDFSEAVAKRDSTKMRIHATGGSAARKVIGAAPHDLGTPHDAPTEHLNAFNYQNPNVWRDLNAKFVLMVYRDAALAPGLLGGGGGGEGMAAAKELIHDTWPNVVRALEYLKSFDSDGDGLPEHETVGSDQTYDQWAMRGATSAYCGSLWIAALRAAQVLGRIEGDTTRTLIIDGWADKAIDSWAPALWNGAYFNFDASERPHISDVIQADALSGQWYSDLVGMPPFIAPLRVESSLQASYHYNVKMFGRGRNLGAVNGFRPTGHIDTSSMQAEEVWTGSSYALASHLLARGLPEEAWGTALGVVNMTYEYGMMFRTPEGWDFHQRYRASMYMRPLSIWALEQSLAVARGASAPGPLFKEHFGALAKETRGEVRSGWADREGPRQEL